MVVVAAVVAATAGAIVAAGVGFGSSWLDCPFDWRLGFGLSWHPGCPRG